LVKVRLIPIKEEDKNNGHFYYAEIENTKTVQLLKKNLKD
jgi:hypothetical protein